MEANTHSPTIKESTIVERVARIVSSVRGTKPDYTRLAAELEPTIPFDVFGVALLQHDRRAVRVTICQRQGSSWIVQHHQHPLVGSMVEQLLQAPTTRVKNYPDGLNGLPAECGDALSSCHYLYATLITPLIAGDRVLGTLELGSVALNIYTDDTLQRLIEAVVHVVAAAIESAQVGGSAEIQDRQRQVLKTVSSALASKMDLSSILNHIVDGIAQALNVASAIVTFDQRQGTLCLEAYSGLDADILRKMISRKAALTDLAIIGYTLRRRQPLVSHDMSTDERFPVCHDSATELGVRSVFCYPLVTNTVVYGVLLLCAPEPGGFTPLKSDIFSLFASQATIAISNAMLIEAAQLNTLPGVPSFQEEEGVMLLAQTTEAALVRAEALGELGRLFTQVKQSTNHIKDAWFLVDLSGLCIYMNPAAEVFCGMHRGIVTESTIEDLFAELLPRIRNRDEVLASLHDFDQSNMYRYELRLVLANEPIHTAQLLNAKCLHSSLHLDGAPSDQYYQLSHYPLLNQQGTLMANALQIQDVTAQVRDEKNKSALLSSVSHDLRTPLTTIKAAVTGLLQVGVKWDEHTQREILEEIDAETDHLGVLIEALVEMSRIEMGALVLDKEWCDIAEIVHGALLRLERILAGRSVHTSFQPHLPLLYADHVQLERVFYNLIESVVRQSTGHTEIFIAVDTVSISTAETPLHSLRVKMTDHSYGVSPGEREHIFKTFYGLNVHGSGLGLAICRGIVEAHQGRIGVEATSDGNGSYFVFTLPISSSNGLPTLPKTEEQV